MRPPNVVQSLTLAWVDYSARNYTYNYYKGKNAALTETVVTSSNPVIRRSDHPRFGQVRLGRVLALDSRPPRWCSYPLARWRRRAPRRIFILLNSPAVLAAGRSRGKLMGLKRTLFIHLQRRRAPRRTKLVSRATGSGRLRVAPPAALRWLCPRTCARSRFRAGTVVVFIRWQRWRRRAPRRIFILLNSPAVLAAGRATGSSPSAGRSRGKLMVSRTCARSRFRAGTVVVFIRWQRWRRRAPRRIFILLNSPAVLAAGRELRGHRRAPT